MKKLPIHTVIIICLALSACSGCGKEKQPSSIRVMTYNVQTLFDAIDHGGEYDDFVVSKGLWNENLYKLRLKALASAIVSAGGGKQPEVLVIQEIENKRVLADLAEEIGAYPHILLSPNEEAILSCGILSGLPVKSFNAHRIMPPVDGPSSVPRFALEAELCYEGRTLLVLAVHLKSKLGGDAATEIERRRAAAFIKTIAERRLAERPELAIVIAGDFNENHNEYERTGRAYPTALMPEEAGPGEWLLVSAKSSVQNDQLLIFYDPWFDYDGYSYRYNGENECIDHLLLSDRKSVV